MGQEGNQTIFTHENFKLSKILDNQLVVVARSVFPHFSVLSSFPL
jgi:hypothetical protein